MIIALCSTGDSMQSTIDERFGRASYFLFYNTESSDMVPVINEAKTAKGGAGALAVQQLVNNKAELLIAPEVGPQALDALKQFKIPVYRQGEKSTAALVIEAWQKGSLELIKDPGNKGMHKA